MIDVSVQLENKSGKNAGSSKSIPVPLPTNSWLIFGWHWSISGEKPNKNQEERKMQTMFDCVKFTRDNGKNDISFTKFTALFF